MPNVPSCLLMISTRYVVAVFLTLLPCHGLRADECSDVLAEGLGNRVNVEQRNGFDAANKHFRCLKANQNSSQGSGGSVNARYGAFSGGGSTSSNSSSGASNEDCGSGNAQQHESAFLYYSQVMYTGAIDAWKACMLQRQSFACWAEPDGGDQDVIINLRWGILGSAPEIKYSRLTVGGRETNTRFTVGSKLDLDENVISVPRSSREAITFVVQAAPQGMGSKRCVVYVPPKSLARPPERTVHQGQWQASSVGGGGIMAPMCNCVQVITPPPPQPPMPAGPGMPPRFNQFGAGSVARIFNRCQNDVRLTVVGEAGQPPYPPPSANYPSRTYIQQTLKKEHELQADISGKIMFGMYVDLCPQQNTLPPPPFPGGPGAGIPGGGPPGIMPFPQPVGR